MFHRDKPDLCQQMKRSKQKSMQSPKLTGRGGRSRSDSLASQASEASTVASPGSHAAGGGGTGMTPLLTNLRMGGSPPNISLDGPVMAGSTTTTTTYHTSFRSGHDSSQPRTGLGVLHTMHHQHPKPTYTPEQQRLMQQDAQDRERQARALSEAGMAAERAGLHPPPILGNPTFGGHASSPTGRGKSAIHVSTTETWHADAQTGGQPSLTLEEMETDFATLFDPNVELESMQTEGSGWPQMNSGGHVQSDMKPPAR